MQLKQCARMALAQAASLPYNACCVATHLVVAVMIRFHPLLIHVVHPMTPSPHAPDTKNLILALVLGTAIMAGWQLFYEQPRLAAQKAYIEQQRARDAKTAETNTKLNTALNAPTIVKSHEEIVDATHTPRVTVSSDTLHGSIALTGGRIDDLTLAQYHETIDPKSSEVELLSPAGSPSSYFAEFGWLGDDSAIKVPTPATRWQADRTTLSPNSPVTLRWENGGGLKFEKKVSLDRQYLFTVASTVTNHSSQPVTLYPYGRLQRSYNEAAGKHFAVLHEGPLAVFNNTLSDVKYKNLREEGAQQFTGVTGWFGFTDKYWLSAIVPDKDHPFNATMSEVKNSSADPASKISLYQVDYRSDAITIVPNQSITLTQYLFAGAKKVSVLDDYRDRMGFALFDRAVDFGRLYFLTKPIFALLDKLYGVVGNFGVSILILTVFIKLLMFPLANKSYTSMSQMKLLMPKIKEIQERYKDDKLKMNTEVMEFYKREKVNPMSGCLPLLIQIPVFFALYKVLFVTIEMRHAPFFGWIQDLSAADPSNIFTLFGYAPWTVPAFLHLGVWPIIMCVTMVMQQRLNPKPADELQAKIMSWMPFMFLYLFASFPAGLVIYWAWNNTLSILQQRTIQWKLERAQRPAQD
jgi:YidC/Oxa1 family membrane protein insertase